MKRGILGAAVLVVLFLPCISFAGVVYVDDDGPGDPFPGDPNVSDPLEDGSEYHPFDAIQEAVDAANPLDTILIRNGLYLDEGNYNIRINKPVNLKGEGGPENCVIDCQYHGPGLLMTIYNTEPIVFEGLGILHTTGEASVRLTGNVTIRNCRIQNNQSISVYCYSVNNTILNCVIQNNTREGIYCQHESQVRIEGCVIRDNETLNPGGGIYCGYNSRVEVQDCHIQLNESAGIGGGIYSEGYITVTDCDIQENTADLGGGLSIDSGEINHCRIQGNRSNGSGGGIFAYGYITVKNCLISDNQAGTGGAVSSPGSVDAFADIEHCTIVNNHADARGGGFFGSGRVKNSILWGNSATDGAQLWIYDFYLITHSIVADDPVFYNSSGSKLILRDTFSTDPNFADGENGDYHLNPVSPCIDAGDDDLIDGVSLTDLDGQVRILDGNGDGSAAADLGCYEYVPAGESVIQMNLARLHSACLPNDLLLTNFLLRIFNSGSGLLHWSVEENCDWLEVSPATGTADPNGIQVIVTMDGTGLDSGVYTCPVVFRDDDSLNQTYTVTAVLYIVPETGFWVPYHYSTIQGAVDAAGAGDTILVADGTYYESLTINKPIILRGATDPEYCILAGTGQMNVKGISGGQYILEEMTVTGFEQGIYNNSLDTEIRNCIVRNNCNFNRYGGGIFSAGTALFENCLIEGNVGGTGGGIFAVNTIEPMGLRFVDCQIRENIAYGLVLNKTGGGGAYLEGYSSVQGCSIQENISRVTGGGAAITASTNGMIENSLISDNSCGTDGGGIFIQNSTASFRNLSVQDNTAERDGGGIYAYMGQTSLGHAIVKGNTAGSNALEWGNGNGGGICLFRGTSDLSHCEIAANFSLFGGGGIGLLGGDLTLSNSTIQGNTAMDWGGGIESCGLYYFSYPDPRYPPVYPANLYVKNCTILWNRAFPVSGLITSGGIYFWYSEGEIANSILWGNECNVYGTYLPLCQQIHAPGPSHSYPYEFIVTVKFCDIQDWPGLETYEGLVFEGCMNTDPNFAAAGVWDEQGTAEPEDDLWIEGDYHLRSAAGRWDASIQQWVTDEVSSPCIDAGDPNDLNWQNELWPHGGRINMGAYGGTAEASMSPDPAGNTADLNHDGAVDLADWSQWADDWLFEKVLIDSDFDRDNDTDIEDLVIFAGQWCWVETE